MSDGILPERCTLSAGSGWVTCAFKNKSRKTRTEISKHFFKERYTEINLLLAKLRFSAVKSRTNDKIL